MTWAWHLLQQCRLWVTSDLFLSVCVCVCPFPCESVMILMMPMWCEQRRQHWCLLERSFSLILSSLKSHSESADGNKPTSDNVAILKCQFVRCAAIQWSSSTLPNALLMNYDGTPFLHLLWCHAKQNQQTWAKPHPYKWSSSYLLSFINACWLLSVASSTWETHAFKYDRWSR